MILTAEDIKAIASEVVRQLSLTSAGTPPPMQRTVRPGSYNARKQDADDRYRKLLEREAQKSAATP